MNVKGKNVLLRAIERDDLPLLQKWANDPEICSMIGGWHFPTNMNDQNKWFDSLNVQSLNQRFAIEVPESGLLGTANLVDINWKDRNAFHGILIGDQNARNKGYAADTIFAIMKYAFDELGLNRLDTTIIAYNVNSINLYTKKCGWTQEGVQKDWYFRNGSYCDRLWFGITRKGYLALTQLNGYWNEQ